MSPVNSRLQNSRRSLAIGIWALLVLTLAFASPGMGTVAALAVVLLVSTMTAVALLLVGGDSTNRPLSPAWSRLVPIVVSSGIPLGWALLLGSESSLIAGIALVVMAVAPVCLASIVRSSPVIREPLSITPIERFARGAGSAEAASEMDDEIEGSGDEVDSGDDGSEGAEDEEPLLAMESPAPNVTQWLTRSWTDDGEVIAGGLRVDFADGQRDAIVHLSFCPPFRCRPELSTEDLDSANLEIRVSAAFPFGARLAVRRGTASIAPAEKYRIGFVAVATRVRRAA